MAIANQHRFSQQRQQRQVENGHYSNSRSSLRVRSSPGSSVTPSSYDPNATILSSRDVRRVRVSGLNPETVPGTIFDAFSRWGLVKEVEMGLDGNERRNCTATILFKEKPWNTSFLNDCVIDGRRLKVEIIPFSPREHQHQRRVTHSTNVPAASLSLGTKIGPNVFVEEWRSDDNVSMVIQYTRRQIQINFSQKGEKYQMEWSFKDMTNGEFQMERDGTSAYFTIQLKFPARFWHNDPKSRQETELSVRVGSEWCRIKDLPMPNINTTDETKPISPNIILEPEPGKARLGIWTTYRIKFSPSTVSQKDFDDMLAEASEYNLVPRDTTKSNIQPLIKVVQPGTLPPPRYHVQRALMGLPYDVLYMIESLIHSYQFNEHNLDDEFYEKIKQLDPQIVIGILKILYASKEQTYDPLGSIKRIFDKMGDKVRRQRRIPEHCAMVRKIIVTPTTMYLQPDSIEMTNRVVRHYSKYTDRFMRIQFMDDGMSKMSAAGAKKKTKFDAIYKRFHKALKNGIQIGTVHYVFLCFSSSQLREHGCWFFAMTPDVSAYDIRKWMGNFDEEKTVAKYAARMGQCFSSTQPITRLEHDEVEYIDDVIHNGYTFSDGVGTMSRDLAEEVAAKMGLNYVPSAIQFRFAGAKGVLSRSPTLLKGKRIQLRPSQIKFDSDHYELEVARVSNYIPGYLNRQSITILSTLGVPDDVFMKKMRSTIETMNRIMSDPPQAIKTLMMYEDPYGTTQSMAKMIQAGFLEKRDPHIVNLINMFRVNMLKDLKKKAKILIHKGAFVLGILDETRTLQEGEVFCQISAASNKGRGKKIIQGDVIVYRNPCFHPGDIRVVKAVNNPKLHHLKDVIVFSAQGYRDVPSMCSGGDLDGDDFTILWDDELLPHTRNYDPMEYKATPPKKVEHVRLLHIFDFYIGYMKNDNLGSIANAHLATADQSSKNARDGNCIRLAQLHSEAVDFPKTGRAAVMDDDLRVQVFPDFMEKEDKESYESQKVLGKIYRAIDKADYDEYESRLVDNTVYDVRLRVPDMEHYIQEARNLKKEYGRDILALMNQYGVKTESELVSGYIIKWLKESNRKSDYEIHEETMKTVLSLKKNWRRRFEQDLEDVPGARHAKAASWYYCTYHPDERMNDYSLEGNLLSFPWVVDDIICEIAMMNNNRVATEDQAKPIDDVLVSQLASAKKQDLKFTMIYSSDEEDADEEEEGNSSDGEEDEETVEHGDDKEDDDEEDDREEDAITTFVLSKPQKQNKQESPKVSQETTITVPNIHTAVAANATEDELANALLGL